MGEVPAPTLEVPMSDNRFVWYTLNATDPAAARAFYTETIGWSAQDMPMPNGTYTVLQTGETGRAGIAPEAAPASQWMAYLAVEDLEAGVERVTANGGSVLQAPFDIPGVGRAAAVADPQGAVFLLFCGEGGFDAPTGHGAFHWMELNAADPEAALPFYRAVFGFEVDSMPMPGGTYFVLKQGDAPRAGVAPSERGNSWLPWIEVDDTDAAAARVQQNGGTVDGTPMDVPGVGRTVVATDAVGARFGLITPAARA